MHTGACFGDHIPERTRFLPIVKKDNFPEAQCCGSLSEVAILKHDHKWDRKPDSCSGASVELLAKQHE
jgi:hypothetical protein